MRKFVIGLTSLAMVAVACTSSDPEAGGTTGGPRVRAAAFALRPFDACGDLLSYLTSNALERVTAFGLPGLGGGFYYGGPELAVDDFARRESAPQADGAAPSTGGQAGVDFSTTNVQEAGVDEPDIVKTNGELVLAVSNGKLRAVNVTGEQPVEVGEIDLPEGWQHEILISGTTAILFTQGQGFAVPVRPIADDGALSRLAYPGFDAGITELRLIDFSDPSDMQVTETLRLDGLYVTARMIDGVARVVIRSQPTGLVFAQSETGGVRGERLAKEANEQVIRESTVDQWLPFFVHTDANGNETDGTLLDCPRVNEPPTFSGFGTASVLTIDIERGLAPVDATAVLAQGETVYASIDRLYVSTNQWLDWELLSPAQQQSATEEYTTAIHAFDITAAERTRYVASGEVRGHTGDQWSFSEHEGNLRVVTTEGSPWGPVSSESYLTVLGENNDGTMTELGQVGELGKGEQVQSVRYIGDTGYVVTFRQIDPLYVIDLSDPTNPTVAGELKITGFSAYLHPVGDGLLLGIGTDATEEGRVQGAQIALFDVSDPTNPTQVAKTTLSGGHSDVSWDHRAFLWWAASELAMVPIQAWSEQQNFAGAVGYTVDIEGKTITELARVTHPNPEEQKLSEQERDERDAIAPEFSYEWQPPITRSLVVGDTVYTLSESGLKASALNDLTDVGFVSFLAN